VTINPLPVVNLGPDVTQCSGSVTLNAGNTGFEYLWSPGSATTQTITTSTSGIFNVRVTNPATGCINRDTITVTIHPLPVVNLGPDVTQCAGTVTLDAGNPGFAYLWTPGNQTTQTRTVTTSGTYIVRVTNPATGCFSFDTAVVTINPLPVVNLGPDVTQCSGSVTLNAGNTGFEYLWSPGSATTQTITTSTSGTFNVRVTNPATGCVNRDTITVTINPLPVVNLGPDVTQCAGTVTLDAGNPGFAYLWTPGNQTTQTRTVTTSGTYIVRVTNPVTGCFSFDTAVVTINPLPTSNIAGSVSICEGDSALLTISLPTGSFTATLFDGTTSTVLNGVGGNQSLFVRPLVTTTYTILSLSNSLSGCVVTAPSPLLTGSATVLVSPLPTAALTGLDTVCLGDTAELFLALSPGLFQVVLTDGVTPITIPGISGNTIVNVQPTTTTNYQLVSVVNSITNCAVSAPSPNLSGQANVVVENLPNATFTYPSSSVCANDSIVAILNGQSGGVFTSIVGLSLNSTTGTVRGDVSIPGSYLVRYDFSGPNGCSNFTSTTLNVAALPAPNAGNDTVTCGSVVLSSGVSTTGVLFDWNAGQGSNSQFVANQTGLYTIRVTDTSTNCIGTDSVQVTVQQVPVVALGNDTVLCSGSAFIDATVSGTALQLIWNSPLGAQDTLRTSASGIFSLTATDTLTGCTATDSIEIAFLPVTISLGSDTSVCNSFTIQPTVSGTGPFSYQWNDTLATTPTLLASTSGLYALVATNLFGCSGTDTISIVIRPTPAAPAWNGTTICLGDSLVLQAGSTGATSFQWSTGDTTSTIKVISGSYSVVISALGCADTSSITVFYTDTVRANFQFVIGGIFGDSVSFTSLSDSSLVHQWLFGNGQSSNLLNPSTVYDSAGTYTVQLVVRDSCGSDTAVASVTILITGTSLSNYQSVVEVYPNPSNGVFTVRYPQNRPASRLTVYDLTMKPILRQEIGLESQQAGATEVHLTDWSAGVYILELVHPFGSSRWRLIRQ
jgi:hypothetical protein